MLTLTPIGSGSLTQLSKVGNSNWEAVSTSDGDTSYVWTDIATKYDFYSLTPIVPVGATITSVSVHHRSRSTVFNGFIVAEMYYNGAIHDFKPGLDDAITETFYKDFFITNPINDLTGVAWTWNDFTGLQFGIRHTSNDVGETRTTQFWVTIQYMSEFTPKEKCIIEPRKTLVL